ncbi:MAG: hypothetical protein ACO1G9_10900 [Bacteroidota bacterium]
MKKLLRNLLLFPPLFLSIFSFADSDKAYLFVEIRGLSAVRGVPDLRKELTAISSIKTFEYCEKSGLLILGTDQSIDSLRSNVNRLLHSRNYHYVIKSPIPIDAARNICNRN